MAKEQNPREQLLAVLREVAGRQVLMGQPGAFWLAQLLAQLSGLEFEGKKTLVSPEKALMVH